MKRMIVVVGVMAVAVGFMGTPVYGQAPALAPGMVFTTEATPPGSDGRYEIKGFSAILVGGKRIEGQPVSDKAVARSLTERWKNENNYWRNLRRLLPTGVDGMAVKYPVDGVFGLTNFTIAVELRGRGWKADSGKEETLVTAEGEGGAVALLSDGKGNLVLRSKAGEVTAKAPASLDTVHSLIAVLKGTQATLYWDGLPLGSGPATGPAKVRTVTLGQVGPGPGDDKDIIRVEIHDRAFIQAQVSQWHLDVGIQPAAHITIVERKHPIKIDGILDPDEWAEAARITGLVRIADDQQFFVVGPSSFASDQSEFYVTYDQEYLYIAHHSPPPARIAGQTQLVVVMLKRTMDKHDDALVFDDNVKITTLDKYPDVGEEKRIYVNGKDTTYDFLPLRWDPKMLNKSRLTDTGWWVEEAIAWKDLNMGAPEPGKTVYLNLQRGWKQELDENHLWTFGRYDAATGRLIMQSMDPNPAGAVTLAGPVGVVVRLDEIGPFNQGKLDIRGTVVNLTGAEKKIKAGLESNSGMITNRQELIVAAGARQSFQFTGTITDFKTSVVTLRVTDAADGKEYLAQGWPVRRRYEPEIYIRKYRSQERIAFENNFEYLSETPVEKIKAKLVMTSRDTGKTMFESNIVMRAYSTRDEVSTKDWPIGKYDVAYRFKSGFKTLGEAKTMYDRVPLPAWWNNELGNEEFQQDVVPYPWTDMAVNGTTLDCWGRRYHFGDTLLPTQIETQNRPLLRAPMTVKAVAADGSVLSSETAKVSKAEWTKKTKTRVEGIREIGNEALTLRNAFWAEYDGFVWCKLTIVPKPGKKLTLNGLTLEIPLTPEFTDVMNTYDYGMTNTKEIHPFTGSALPIWLGNGNGGIQWLNETDGSFFVKDLKAVTEVVPGSGEGGTIRVTMINLPTDFEKPHEIEFGFNVTPTRPKLMHTAEDPYYWGLIGSICGYWYPEGQPFQAAPDWGTRGGWRPWPGAPSRLKSYSGLGRLYVTTATANVNNPDGQNFGDEWLSSPGTRLSGPVSTTHASKTYRDYFVWRHWNALNNQVPYQSWYYDGATEMSSANAYAGAGYVRRDGTRVAQRGILGARDICRRMYNIMVRWYPFALIGMHNSGMLNTAWMSFGTQIVDGENLSTMLTADHPTYKGWITPASMRAEYMGYNFAGQPNMLIGEAQMGWEAVKLMGGADNLFDHLHGLELLHDVPPSGWLFGNDNTQVLEQAGKRTYDAVEKNNLFTPFYEFVPYWNQKVVTEPFKDFYSSFYIFRHDAIDALPMKGFSKFQDMTPEQQKAYRKVVCIFYNHSDDAPTNKEMRLKLDWKALGFEGSQGVTAVNAVHSTGFRLEKTKDKDGKEVDKAVFFPKPEETARIEGDEVIFPMTPWNYRMIVLEVKK